MLLFVTSLVLIILRLVRPRFRFGWLAAFVAAVVAFATVLTWRFQLPISAALPGWGSTVPFSTPPAFSADSLSWTYALAVSSLLLAGLLVAPAWPDFQNSIGLPLALAFFAVALLAVAADNILTVVIAWAAMDITEAALTLRWAGEGDDGTRTISIFSARLASLALVLLVPILNGGAQDSSGYNLLMVAAVALRLVVLPTRALALAGAYVQSGIGVALQLASAVASLALLSRIQPSNFASPGTEMMLIVIAGAALYSGWMWLRAADDPSSRKFWILTLSFLAAGSSLLGSPVGATAWGICLLLIGGSLVLSSARQAWLNRALLIGAWGLSALPFSLAGGGWSTPAEASNWILPAFVLAQALLLAGFLHHATRPTRQLSIDAQPGWVRGTYVAGIGLLLFLEVALGLLGWDGSQQTQSWLPGIIATGLGLAVFWGRSRVTVLDRLPRAGLQQGTVQAGSLMQRGLSSLSEAVRRLISGITGLFEGDAGIMWGLLFLVLVVSLIVGRSP